MRSRQQSPKQPSELFDIGGDSFAQSTRNFVADACGRGKN